MKTHLCKVFSFKKIFPEYNFVSQTQSYIYNQFSWVHSAKNKAFSKKKKKQLLFKGDKVAHWYAFCLRIWRSAVQTSMKTNIYRNLNDAGSLRFKIHNIILWANIVTIHRRVVWWSMDISCNRLEALLAIIRFPFNKHFTLKHNYLSFQC